MWVPWAPGQCILTVEMSSLLSPLKTITAWQKWVYDQNVIFLSNCNIRPTVYTHISGIRVLDHLYFCWDMCESTIQYCFPGSFYCILSVLEIRDLCNTQCVLHLAADQPLRYLLKYKKKLRNNAMSQPLISTTPGTTIQPFILSYTFLSTVFHKSKYTYTEIQKEQ